MSVLDSQPANGLYPYPGYNFRVCIDNFMLSFKSVSGITLRKDTYTAYHEGGNNFHVDLHRDRRSEVNRLTLTKGVGFFNPAKDMSVIGVLLVIVFDNSGVPINAYSFSSARLEQVTVSDFDAATSQAVIDTTVIAYDTATEVDLLGTNSAIKYGNQKGAKLPETAGRINAASVSTAKIAAHNKSVNEKSKSQKKRGGAVIER